MYSTLIIPSVFCCLYFFSYILDAMDGVAARKFNQCPRLIVEVSFRFSLWSSAWYDMRPVLYVFFISGSCLHLSGIQIFHHSYAYTGDHKSLDSDVLVQIGFLFSLVLLLWVKVTKRLMKSVRGFCASTTWFPILSLLSVCLTRLGFSQITCSTCFSSSSLI